MRAVKKHHRASEKGDAGKILSQRTQRDDLGDYVRTAAMLQPPNLTASGVSTNEILLRFLPLRNTFGESRIEFFF
jgi:hypothetical protein